MRKGRFLGFGGLFLLVAALGEGCLGANPDSQSQCQIFGGTCVASVTQCGGTLPYACNSGVCCESLLAAPPDAAAVIQGGDASTSLVKDATILTPTPDATTGGMEAASQPDVAVAPTDTGMQTMPDTGMQTMPDTGTPHDAGGMPDAEADAHQADAGSKDAESKDAESKDAGSKDAGEDAKGNDAGRDLDAGFICNSYASPNEPEASFPGTAVLCNPAGTMFECPGNPLCQPNGCYNGDYCHLATGNCVMPSAVKCDGGL